jgi:hypothetical protein
VGVSQTTPLSANNVLIATRDFQASVTFARGAFGIPKGQHSVSITIRPLFRSQYRPPRIGRMVLDGNVYGLSFHFLPSHRSPTLAVKPVILGLSFPHTPGALAGFTGGHWKALCTGNGLVQLPQLWDCYTNILPTQVAYVYNARARRFPVRHRHRPSSGVPIPIIIAIVIVVLWAGMVVFLLTRRRAR